MATIPSTDIKLNLTLNANGSITANWVILPGTVKQKVYVSQVGKGHAVERNDDWSGNSYTTKANLAANAQYDVLVTLIGEHVSVGSGSKRILIPYDFYDNQPIDVPQNIKITPAPTQITVSFSAVARAKSYDILFDNKVYNVTTTSKTFTGLSPKTSHTIAVRARGAKLTSAYSATQTVRTLPVSPAVPLGVHKTATETSATLKWNAVSGAISYDVLFDGRIYTTTTNSKTITGLTAGRSYSFQVRAKNADLAGEYSSQMTVATPPKPPTSVTATSTADSVTISWNKVAGASGYQIKCNNDETHGLEFTTSIEYGGLKPKTSYTYQVACRTLDGIGSYSAAKSIMTLAKMPDIPLGIIGETTDTSVTVTWDPVSDATGYDIQFNGSTYSTTTPSRTFTGLREDTEYAYKVRSKNADGVSDYGEEKKVRTTPKAPAGATVSSDENSVTVSWDPVKGATSYDLMLDDKVYRTTGTSHKVTGLKPNTSHSYRIRVNNAHGSSAYSSAKTLKTTPNPPETVRETASQTNITLRWDSVSGATSYDVLFHGTTYRVTGTSKTISGLTANTSYNYQIRSNNADGSSSYSQAKTIKTLPYAPSTYPTVKATASTDSVTLTWNAVTGATDYELYFNGKTTTVQGTSYKATGLSDDTSYSYRIRSHNEGGYSGYSSYMTVRTALKAPGVPTGLRATSGSDYVSVSWNSVSKAQSYDLYFNGVIYNTTSTYRTISGLRPETTYQCKVCAKNAAGSSPYSAACSIRTQVAPPRTPANVRAEAGTDSVTVSWGSVSGATGYKLIFNGELYKVTGNSKTISGLKPGTEYVYSVCASNAGGNSAFTEKQTVKTIAVGPAVPSDVTASAEHNRVRVSFSPVKDASDYDILFDGETVHVDGTVDAASGKIHKTFSGLQPNTEHTYCARANNADGSSHFSPLQTVRIAVNKQNGRPEHLPDRTYPDGKPSYTGNDPINVLTGAFLWEYTCLEDYGKDRLNFTLLYDSDRPAFGKAIGEKWSYQLYYLLYMDEEYAYFCTPYGAVIPFSRSEDNTFDPVEGIGAAYAMELGDDGSYAVTTADGTEYVFDSSLVLNKIVENGLVKYQFEKDQAGNISRITGRHGSSLTFTYAGQYLTSVKDAADHSISLSYESRHLSAVTNQAGRPISFTYDDNDGLLTIADLAGQIYLENTYDVFGRVTGQSVAGRGESSVVYDETNRKTVFTDELGNTTTYQYDENGNVTDVELAESGIHNSYNENGMLVEQTDALGNSTKMTYDAQGRMNGVTYPDGTQEQVFYNDNNLPVRIVNRDGTECKFGYDDKNNLISVEDERGNSGTYVYDENDNLTSWTDKEGNEWYYLYDEAGHLRQAEDPEGNIYQYVHDAAGRLISYTSPEGRNVAYDYNMLGELYKIKDADGEVLFGHDVHGNCIEITDRRGHKQTLEYNGMGQLSSATDFLGNKYLFTYDAGGRLVKEKDPLGAETNYSYDARGNLTAHADKNGNVTAYAFDAANRLTQITDAAGGILRYAYDAMGRIGKVIDPLERQTTYLYDAMGRLLCETDALGHSVSYTYDQAGNLLTRTDEDGNETTYTYDGENRLLTETTAAGTTGYTYDKLGRVTEVTLPDETKEKAVYDADGNPVEISDQEENKTAYVYDDAGHLTEMISPDGSKTTYQYDKNGNCKKVTDAEGNSRSYVFDANNRITAVTDALGKTTACEYDEAGRLIAVTDAGGGRSVLAYDAGGNLISETDPLGGIRAYTYDSLNRVIKIVDEEGHVRSCNYDAAGNMSSFTDANDNSFHYDYDALNRLIRVTDENNGTVTMEYTNTGKVAKVTDQEGAVTTYQYDGLGRLLKMTDASDHSLAFTYDSMGRVLTQTDACGSVTTYTYSPVGNLISTKDPAGNVTSYTYNGEGQITKVTDALGNATTYTRDALGQVTEITDPAGEKRTFTYTANGQIKTVTDACGNVTTYTYDACGNLIKIKDPLEQITTFTYDAMNHCIRECMSEAGQTTCETIYQYDKRGCMIRQINPVEEERSYTYDGNGNLTGITDEEGNVTTVTYDLNNLPAKMCYSDGREAAFRYNKRGELVEMTDWNGTMSVERDVLGRVTGVTDHDGHVTGYSYDPAGNKTAIRYPDESVVNYTYDGSHRLTGVTDAEGRGTQYSYDAVGNLLSMVQPGGEASYTYNAVGLPVTAGYQTDDGGVKNWSLTYDAMGRITGLNRRGRETEPAENSSYAYDALGRLLSYTEGAVQEAYSYDMRGNRTKCRINGTDSATCLYDAMNRLTRRAQDGTVYNYAYDKRGNLTEERQDGSLIRQYVYDTANRMVTGKDLLSGAQTDYTYNALNMRIANTLTLPGTEAPQIMMTAYVPDFLSGTDNDLMAYHSGGGVTGSVYGRTFERLGSISATGQKYEMPDLWGSPMYTADAQGNAEWCTGHDIWGRPSEAETDADKRFTNYLYDPVIGKYFAQARFYDSGQGRMLSPDPIKRRINPYPYCDNDPVNYNDPTGEIPSILLGAGLGGLIGGASGFIGSAASQLTGGGKFNWKKAIGAAANGAVVGTARGALIGSGAGIPLAFATDFAAGSVGNALEQGITKGRVDLGESLISGAGNALSEVLYGTGPIRGVKDAFLRGARTGAVMSGLDNIARAAGLRGAEPGSNPGGGGRIRGVAGAGIPGHAGRDPRKMCGSTDPFDLAETLGDRKRSHSGRGRSRTEEGGGFSLGGLVKDVAIGGIVGGLGSAAFYGAREAVERLRESVDGRGVRYREGRIVDPLEVTYDMRLNPEEYAYAVANKYGINLRGSGQRISIKFDPYHIKGPGVSRKNNPTKIILGPQALISEEELARTISHELNHARSWLKGGWAPENTARAAENALGDFINGGR